jgi:hypothetical protein
MSSKVSTIKGRVFSGRLDTQNEGWKNAKLRITERETDFFLATLNGRSALSEANIQLSSQDSYYLPKFRQGADLMPRRIYFVKVDDADTSEVVEASSNTDLDAKPPYNNIEVSGLVDRACLFKSIISQNILPFVVYAPFDVHLPLVEENEEWKVANPELLASHDLGYSSEWFTKCDRLYSQKAKVKKGKLFENLNYNNKLLVQNPRAKRWVVFNSAGTNVSAAMYVNDGLFWVDQRTYWYCPTSKGEGDYLVAILNAPSLNEIIKPFQSMGLAGERDIHKKVLELIPKYDSTDSLMHSISGLGARAALSVRVAAKAAEGKGIASKRKAVRDHITDELAGIDAAVKSLLSLKG